MVRGLAEPPARSPRATSLSVRHDGPSRRSHGVTPRTPGKSFPVPESEWRSRAVKKCLSMADSQIAKRDSFGAAHMRCLVRRLGCQELVSSGSSEGGPSVSRDSGDGSGRRVLSVVFSRSTVGTRLAHEIRSGSPTSARRTPEAPSASGPSPARSCRARSSKKNGSPPPSSARTSEDPRDARFLLQRETAPRSHRARGRRYERSPTRATAGRSRSDRPRS